MGKKFSKTVTKRTKVRLSPRDAEEIIKEEFVDSKGRKTITDINITPHSPTTPTIQGIRKDKD